MSESGDSDSESGSDSGSDSESSSDDEPTPAAVAVKTDPLMINAGLRTISSASTTGSEPAAEPSPMRPAWDAVSFFSPNGANRSLLDSLNLPVPKSSCLATLRKSLHLSPMTAKSDTASTVASIAKGTSLCSSEPEAELMDDRSVLESDAEVSINFDAVPLSVQELLQWRSTVEDGKISPEYTAEVIVESSPRNERSAPSKTPSKSKASRDKSSKGSQGKSQKQEKASPCNDAGQWRAPTMKLEVGEASWAAKQRMRKNQAASDVVEDAEIHRRVKALLNKLTLEKFSQIYRQLLQCGISTPAHMVILIQEVFEIATTQHHFINMYADLCVLLHENDCENPVSEEAKYKFKKLLLTECQASFERNLTPPSCSEELDEEERTLQEIKYKTRMLGNIRFVGALLSRKILASKVLVAILEELLSDPTTEALESLAVLLTSVGATFDTPGWANRPVLESVFKKIAEIVREKQCVPRVRCLLKDVLELRAAKWLVTRPQKQEGPSTLDEVAKQQDDADKAPMRRTKSCHGSKAPDSPKISKNESRKTMRTTTAPTPSKDTRRTLSDMASLADALASTGAKKEWKQDDFRAEVSKAFKELRYGGDVTEASQRLVAAGVPPKSNQEAEFCEMLSECAQLGNTTQRRQVLESISSLYKGKVWSKESFSKGLSFFMEEVYSDLICDVPSLSKIVSEEFKIEFEKLVECGAIKGSDIDCISQI
eukprot:TRINITY_DN6326_c2_g1_i1.p1 TRINITY_DN6326_c2_g1~~TRINITY_DN6326_c2_g1_i1.p1  ORF type:complete len:763 (+),score=187.84 TRINITY_DN6326_c2_g1_i1:153-2291(+)